MDTLAPNLDASPWLSGTEARVDVETVLEISDALSPENQLGRLVELVLRTALERSAARRGLLLVSRNGGLRVLAEAVLDGESIVVHQRDLAAADAELSLSIIERAAQTKHIVSVDDAAEPSTFSSDDHLKNGRARSVLCLPLARQGALVGALYLEHGVPNAFAPDRVAVLRVLASSAATALENSRLYAELEHREQKIMRLVNANIIGVATCDEDGRILEANDAFLDIVGYTRDDLAAGRIGWPVLTPPEWLAVSMKAVAEIQATGRCDIFEKEYFRKDGSRVPILMASAAIDESKREIVALVLDLTARKRTAEALARSEAAIATERSRLAGEIHDTLAQGLAMIVMQLADAEAKLGPAWSRAEKPLSIVRELAVESLAYARRSVNMLRPSVGGGGLVRSIRSVVESLRRHFGGSLSLAVAGDEALLDASVESAFVGIAREGLTNAVKHSGATRVTVEVNYVDGGAARVVVSDDGIGFDANSVRADAYGLVSMQERATRAGVALTFVTEPGAGTTIVASWSPESDGSMPVAR